MRNGRMRRIVELLKWKKPGDFIGGIEPIQSAPAASLSRRDQKIARLYEQGASKEHIRAYLRRWLGWAGVGVVGCVALVACAPISNKIVKDVNACTQNVNQQYMIIFDNIYFDNMKVICGETKYGKEITYISSIYYTKDRKGIKYETIDNTVTCYGKDTCMVIYHYHSHGDEAFVILRNSLEEYIEFVNKIYRGGLLHRLNNIKYDKKLIFKRKIYEKSVPSEE